jgi:hypothetical protein
MQTSLRSSLFVLAALGAASQASADKLFVGSPSTLILEGTPFEQTSNVIAACGGAVQAMVADGDELFVSDPQGRIYHRTSASALSLIFTAPNDARALAFHNGDLMVGGSDQTVARLDRVTGQVLATITAPFPVGSLAVEGDELFIASSLFPVVERCDANTGGGMSTLGTCGGPVNSMALDPTHMFIGSTDGFVYRFDRSTNFVDAFFDAGSDCDALVVHLGDVLVGGSNGVVRRIDRNLGTAKASWTQSVAISAFALVDDGEPGTAYCFGTACPCGNHDPAGNGGCANATGWGARLTGSGTASIAADDLRIDAFLLPKNKPARFYMGGNQNQLAFGGGQLCTGFAGYSIFRFGVGTTTAGGALQLANIVSFANSEFPVGGQITAGSTWNFQGWFRDPGACGGTSSFNTTNAYSVTFLP